LQPLVERGSSQDMREPDFDRDGWCLEDGEERHREAPDKFWIPSVKNVRGSNPEITPSWSSASA